MYKTRIDLTGKRYGNLTVIRYSHTKNKKAYWLCKCDCGKETVAAGSNLKRGAHTSCGCMRAERARVNGKRMTSRGKVSVERDQLRNYKKKAAYRGKKRYAWRLTDEQAIKLMNTRCHYCGGMDARKNEHIGEEFKLNGIDRVDNSKGYEIGNVVPACTTCNKAKNTMCPDQFLAWVKQVFQWSLG